MKAICPQCDSVREHLDRDEADEIVENHNENMHREDEVAVVRKDGMSEEELNSLMDHAKEVSNKDQYEQFVDTVINDFNNFGHLDE
jgi:hypothetical protein